MSTLEEFIKKELAQAEENLKKAMEAKGLKPFLKMEKGENWMTLLPAIPRKEVDEYKKERAHFAVKVNGEEYDYAVNTRSPLYTQLLRKLVTAPTDICVIKTGERQDTKYELK